MRKLNKQNKTYILALSLLCLIVFLGVIYFIVYKVKDLNIKYDVEKNSVTFNSEDEIVSISESSYAKKNLLGSYYLVLNDEKVNLGTNPVIYNKESNHVQMLGTYYEVLASGEVKKHKGQTEVSTLASSYIFKISDRRYLVVSPRITSKDGSLNAKNYLLVNIDKVGNAYLYNNENNIKTFNELEIMTSDFTFKVSEEKLIRDEEEIDLAKIGGSTNEYVPSENPDNGTGDGTGDGDGSGNGSGSGTSGNEPLYPQGKPTIVTGTEIIEQYINRKTSIIGTETTTSEIKINYIVYDPLNEFESLYVELSQNGEVLGTYDMSLDLTNHTLSGLRANETYTMRFYYTYKDASQNTQNVLFDTLVATTKSIKGTITLEKTTPNVVRYIVKIEGGYVLDSANVSLYIDGQLVNKKLVNTTLAASAEGFTDEIEFDGVGDFAIVSLTDCVYNGSSIDITASYKYKM